MSDLTLTQSSSLIKSVVYCQKFNVIKIKDKNSKELFTCLRNHLDKYD